MSGFYEVTTASRDGERRAWLEAGRARPPDYRTASRDSYP
jgi:hypothetical protein